MSPLPVSGATHWASQRWLIVLNGAEPATRQRFSLAHEFKHILDHRFADVLYRNVPEAARHDAIEQVCDYFAGCLLIPRPWLKKAWGQRIQSVDALAAHFETSQAAMLVRLSQVGLASPARRCDNNLSGWQLPRLEPMLDKWTYSRTPPLATIS